jgi:hypothetical protein
LLISIRMEAILPEATLVSTPGGGKMRPDFMIRDAGCRFDTPLRAIT